MTDLRITILQMPLAWQDPAANREAADARIAALKEPGDIILLPETFTSGFCMDGYRPSREDTEKTLDWMWAHARATGAALGCSLITDLGDFAVNRFHFTTPEGGLETYDKVHLIRLSGEDKVMRAGTRRVTFAYKGWKILPIVCYDLRFPVFLRSKNDYDLILCVANWPATRAAHWTKLLQARAIENQAYVTACNRVGHDGNGLDYTGDSVIVDFNGDPLASLPQNGDGVLHAALSLTELRKYREKLPFLQDADDFDLKGL